MTIVFLAAAFLAVADDDGLKGDPDALAALRETVKACRSIAAYQDQGRFVVATSGDGRNQSAHWPIAIRKAGPNRIAIDAGDVRMIADGKTLVTRIGPTRKIMSEPCPPAIRTAHVTEGPLGAMILGGPHGAIARVLLALHFDDDALAHLSAEFREIQAGPDTNVDDRACRTIRVKRSVGPDLILAIDRESKLPRAIDLDANADQFREKVPGTRPLQQARIGWSSGPIQTEPPAPDAFATDAPPGFTPVDPVRVPPESTTEPRIEPKTDNRP